ncbi:MAG: efflux RND transporter periplasmic adaptor subunit [Bryobacteraceae bacterium]|nr:efflux RND transporter periplasmic adaptor subunit [Bryobacteraceae bacterium]MDW8378131.1 efflux RND transporter periplasmic adaptor subunit [Bryobacterales bacterium]
MLLRPVFLFCIPLVFLACQKREPVAKKQESGPIQVRSATVKQKQIFRVVESVGTLYPFDEVLISAEIEGRIDQVNADLGDRVLPGQVLVHISDEEQRYILAQNEAQLRQSLERLGLTSENDRLKDPREAPDVRRAAAARLEAEQRYKNVRNLVEQGIGARVDLDQASARLQAAQAEYDATINQTRNLMQEVERYKAVVELQRKKLRDTSVRAPFQAFVKDRQVAVGQYVRPNTPLFTLVKTDPIRLRLEVPERMAPWIKTGQVAEVGVEAYADRKFFGKIWRISPTVDQTKRTFVVEALIPNPAGELKPGSYARARVPTDRADRVLVVPARAVAYVMGSNKAYVINGDTIEAREVKLGDRFDQEIEILEGLEQGEQVATGPLARLDTGSKVTLIGPDIPASPPSGEPSRKNFEQNKNERKLSE